jgi:hypothetical protein
MTLTSSATEGAMQSRRPRIEPGIGDRSVKVQDQRRHSAPQTEGKEVTRRRILKGLLVIVLLCDVTKVAAAEFSYRGVKFGMTREEISKLVPLEPGTNEVTGRQSFMDKQVAFQFDDKGQLYVVEISYWVPEPVQLKLAAMKRALQKKYAVSNPSEKVWDLGDAFMSLDDIFVTNPSRYLKTTITSKRLYDEYLDRAGATFRPALQD